MTSNRARKSDIRAEMARTGATYNVAWRALEARNWQPLDAVETGIAAAATKAVTIAVTAACGGQGATTVGMLLAAQIAHSSREAGNPLSVVVVDLDHFNGQVGGHLGRYVPTATNLRAQPLWDEQTINEHLVHDTELGVSALLAPVRPRPEEELDVRFYLSVLRVLRSLYDVVVLDTGANMNQTALYTMALNEADRVLFATRPTAMYAYRLTDRLREVTDPRDAYGLGVDPAKIGVIISGLHKKDRLSLDEVMSEFTKELRGIPVLGVIPALDVVMRQVNRGALAPLLGERDLAPVLAELAAACLPNADLAPLPVMRRGRRR